MVSCAIWIDRSLRLGFPNSSASSRPRKRWPHWEGSLVDVIPLDLARDRRFGGIVRVSTPIPTPPPHPLDNRIRRSRATASSPLSTPSTIASSLPSSIRTWLHNFHNFYIFGWSVHVLMVVLQSYSGDEELCCVYVPTNHLYIGDIFLIYSKDVIRPNLSVREGIEIVVSGGMSMPQILATLDQQRIQVDRSRSNRS
uniref:Uncharacterized protein n=1 Tax=Ananas comosus var. bracteatus TaxID=296719 RepID=A0A6V7NSA3_ANACO|nr:unnamed protein product [Ananas comosus var. bracteatus]